MIVENPVSNLSGNNQMDTNMDFVKDYKAILQHVLNSITYRCKEEANINDTEIPLTDFEARISNYTGMPIDIVKNFISENREHSITVSALPIADRILILRAVKTLYLQGILPTYKSIFETVVKISVTTEYTFITNILSNQDLFEKELKTLGFFSKETTNNLTIVIEDPEVRFERYLYLLKLKKIAASTHWQNVVYIDERIINNEQSFKKPILSEPSINQLGIDECVFYHAVSVKGYITGVFINEATESVFTKWLSDILLSHLKEPSVIVLDNSPLHGKQEYTDNITRYHTKTEMLHWLLKNDIPCSNNMSKPALYELTSKCKVNKKDNNIDQIIRSHGHEVLRLPRHFYDISITSQFWYNYAKNKKVPEGSTTEMQCTIMKDITSVLPTDWADYEKDILNIQSQLHDIDTVIEQFCDKYEIKMSP